MRFTTNIEWTKIRKSIIIILLSILVGYLVLRFVILNNEVFNKEPIKRKTEQVDEMYT